jgi:hypothetical protein
VAASIVHASGTIPGGINKRWSGNHIFGSSNKSYLATSSLAITHKKAFMENRFFSKVKR